MNVFLVLLLTMLVIPAYAQIDHLKTKQNTEEEETSTGGGNKRRSTGGGNKYSTGGGNGGETIDLNGDGYESLKDLVDKAVCGDPLWGYELAAQLPEFTKIMTFLDQLHTDLANEVRKELTRVSICLSKVPLVKVNTEDENAVTLFHLDGNQTGVRINNEIFIDDNHFKKTYAKHKGYFLFHELLHGFIPLSAERRNFKVKSFVKGVELLLEKNEATNYPK
ncbi:MAG: hypothetical protein JNM93_06460, partial [Bacteriovoracaceae bacterium]|nr:hypothetical protein [Bacteriovoracaceae bacterium]